MSTSALFQKSMCLSQDDLIRYAKGELSVAEKRVVELHLVDCEICSDAVEGLELVEKVRLNAIEKELSNRIQMRIAADEKGKVIPLYKRWYSMAAAIAALIVISVYMANVYQQDADIAQVETKNLPNQIETISPKISTEALTPQEEPMRPPMNTNAQVAEQKAVTAPQMISVDDAEKSTATKFKSNDDKVMEVAQADEVATETIISANEINQSSRKAEYFNKTVAEKDIAVAPATASEPKPLSDTVTSEPLKTNVTAKKSSGVAVTPTPSAFAGSTSNSVTSAFNYTAYDAGVSAFKSGKYSVALDSMNIVLRSQSTNTNANFYAGAAQYELKNYAQALANLNIATLNRQGLLYEDALWYKGNTLLKMDNKEEAKSTLKKVVKKNGKYKQQAEMLLKGL